MNQLLKNCFFILIMQIPEKLKLRLEKLGTNDLTHMAESLDRIERLLTDMNSRLIYVQAALDGRKP